MIRFWKRKQPIDPMVPNERKTCSSCHYSRMTKIVETWARAPRAVRACTLFSTAHRDLVEGELVFDITVLCEDARAPDGPCKPAGLSYTGRDSGW